MRFGRALAALATLLASGVASAQSFNGAVHQGTLRPSKRVQPEITFTQANAAAGLVGMYTDSSTAHNGGVSWIDYNGDHWPDLFFTNGAGFPHRLFRNNGDGTFDDVSFLVAKPDLFLESCGTLHADVDNDGDTDLMVYVDSPLLIGQPPIDGGPNLLYLNDGDGTFTESGFGRGFVDPGGRRTITGGVADFDRDGYVDFYLANWQPNNVDGQVNFDRILHNDQTGSFVEGGEAFRMNGYGRDALASLSFDANLDGWPDLYVGNAGGEYSGVDQPDDNDIFYVWEPSRGFFCDRTGNPFRVGDDAKASMGMDVGDIDNDGDWDLYITDNADEGPAPLGNVLYLGRGDGTFLDNSCDQSGVCAINSWPCGFQDFDQDGFVDLWVGTTSPAFPVLMFRNDRDGTFTLRTSPALFGHQTRGGSSADYDGDGDVDVFLVNHQQDSVLLRNDTEGQRWISLKLIGTTSNASAIGALVRITGDGLTQMRRVSGGDAAHSHAEHAVHFGTEFASSVEVAIDWPSGSSQVFPSVDTGAFYLVDEDTGIVLESLLVASTATYEQSTDTLTVRVESNYGGRTGFEALGHGTLAYDAGEIAFEGVFTGVTTAPATVMLASARGGSFALPVTIADPPLVDFSADVSSGVAVLSVQFTDLSDPAVTAWAWDFGDGGTSTAQNPSHDYTAEGTYTVSLTATAPAGTSTQVRTDLITVTEPAPTASFTAAPTSGEAPLSVTFTDTSVQNVTAWSWDFGDGATSTAQNPVHVYAAGGTFDVALTVTSSGGVDTDTQIGLVAVTEPAPVASFDAMPASGDAPHSVTFTDTSTLNVTAWDWDFGDGASSTAQNPTHEYSDPGTYDVTLQVTSDGGTDSTTSVGLVTVDEPVPVAAFSGAPTSGNAPLTVTFTDASTLNVTSWSWDFGDGGSSTQANPSHTYTTDGTFDVSLTVTSAGGSDTLTQAGYVTTSEPAPVASFTATPTSGDAPLSVAFTDTSTLNITAWSWTFGDGGSSTAQDPTYEYADPGTYDVSLTVTSAGGSDSTTSVGLVTVDEPAPVASFTAAPTSGDAPTTVLFTDTSTLNVTAWSWTFGDGGTSTAQNPSHDYTTAGTYDVSLVVTSAGGSNSVTEVGYVTIDPTPVASFSGTPTSGDAPLSVAFTDASVGNVTGWSWAFGDGGSSTAQDPTHDYTAAGTYDVTLTITTASGGMDTLTETAYVTVDPTPVAAFSGTPTSGDAPLSVAFTDASVGNVTGWSWTFGDGGSSTAQDPTHDYTAAGTYDVTLTITTASGGMDTLTETAYVTVDPTPVAEFSASTTSGAATLTVDFTDASVGNVTGWSWTFGDGGSSTAQNPTYDYTTPGTYDVSLTITSASGGMDTETKVSHITVTP